MARARIVIYNHGDSTVEGVKEATWQRCFPDSDTGRCYMCDCEITHSDFYAPLLSTEFNGKNVNLISPTPTCSSCHNVKQAATTIKVTDPKLAVLSRLRLNHQRLDQILDIFRDAQRTA